MNRMKRNICLWMFVLLFSGVVAAQKPEIVQDYINTYKQLAIQEMIRTGVPASITLAQGIHETEAGQSDLVLKSNNHFGIKCKTGWQGEKVYHDDDARGECFRSYSKPEESYSDHSDFLKNGSRYAFLFQLDPTDYRSWAYGLKKAGYATNIKYSDILIRLIETYNLQQYTLIAMGKLAPSDEVWVGTKPSTSPSATPASTPVLETSVKVVEETVAPVVSYPSGEFRINETRVIYSRAGTSLLSIAQQYDIPLSRLLDFNELEEEEVLVQDQLIYLQRKRKKGNSEFHIVQKGETMYSISQAEGIRLETVLEYNKLEKAQQPAAGERIYLQQVADAAPQLQAVTVPKISNIPVEQTTSSNEMEMVVHKVASKETLFSIAKKYNTTTEKIKEWNKLESAALRKGQELTIFK
ncbi:MAG: LysM peptidoglycan-binding domain-containing protein [Chitinophagaceae bacterium]|nr:LysM peptidoglycan-binding domain-containing protein [Chitinophagaceae bacterium]